MSCCKNRAGIDKRALSAWVSALSWHYRVTPSTGKQQVRICFEGYLPGHCLPWEKEIWSDQGGASACECPGRLVQAAAAFPPDPPQNQDDDTQPVPQMVQLQSPKSCAHLASRCWGFPLLPGPKSKAEAPPGLSPFGPTGMGWGPDSLPPWMEPKGMVCLTQVERKCLSPAQENVFFPSLGQAELRSIISDMMWWI